MCSRALLRKSEFIKQLGLPDHLRPTFARYTGQESEEERERTANDPFELPDQDARDVRTKFSKSLVTTFFPVGGDIRAIVIDWVDHLRQEKLWGLDDPLFPATKVAVGENLRFEAAGLDRKHWSSAGPIRTIFKEAFASAGLPYFNPHSFRKTLALLGGQRCKTPEEYKAWSQNEPRAVTATFYYFARRALKQERDVLD
jgi:hypothetical protein